ncbi:hypothetical protein [Tunturiibacter gelidiferens]
MADNCKFSINPPLSQRVWGNYKIHLLHARRIVIAKQTMMPP